MKQHPKSTALRRGLCGLLGALVLLPSLPLLARAATGTPTVTIDGTVYTDLLGSETEGWTLIVEGLTAAPTSVLAEDGDGITVMWQNDAPTPQDNGGGIFTVEYLSAAEVSPGTAYLNVSITYQDASSEAPPSTVNVNGSVVDLEGIGDGYLLASVECTDNVVTVSSSDGSPLLFGDSASVEIMAGDSGATLTLPESRFGLYEVEASMMDSDWTIRFALNYYPPASDFAVTVNGSPVSVARDTGIGTDFPFVASTTVHTTSVAVAISFQGTALRFRSNSEDAPNADGSYSFGSLTSLEFLTEANMRFVPPPMLKLTVYYTSQVTPSPDSGDGGGGDSVPSAPAIQVKNELNTGEISSDTTLIPQNTVESDGVSTTTVTDAELAALLELAQAHKNDPEKLDGDGIMECIFSISDQRPASSNRAYVLNLTASQVASIHGANFERLTMQTPAGSFSLNRESLNLAAENSQVGNQQVSLRLDRLTLENRPGVDATLKIGAEAVTVLGDTPYGVQLFIPYMPAADEDVNSIIIQYLREDGTEETVTECRYDTERGGVVFVVSHLSKFGVAYRPAAFSDADANHWAAPYITFLTSRGVISGYAGGGFNPDGKATRGAFLTVLTRAFSAANVSSSAPIQVYSDVSPSSSLAAPACWVYFNNLAAGITTGNTLRPNEAITREDMALLLNNAASGMGLRIRSKGLDAGYTDAAQISSQAQSAVTRLRAAGILEMAENYKFNPKATLNRGEMAQVISKLLSTL